MRLQYELLDDDLDAYVSWMLDRMPRIRRGVRSQRMLGALGAALGVVLAGLGHRGPGFITLCAGLGWVLAVGGEGALRRRMGREIRAALAIGRGPKGPGSRVLELGEEGLYIETPAGESRYDYAFVESPARYGNETVIHVGSSRLIVVPHRGLEPEQLRRFEQALRALRAAAQTKARPSPPQSPPEAP